LGVEALGVEALGVEAVRFRGTCSQAKRCMLNLNAKPGDDTSTASRRTLSKTALIRRLTFTDDRTTGNDEMPEHRHCRPSDDHGPYGTQERSPTINHLSGMTARDGRRRPGLRYALKRRCVEALAV